MLGRALTVWFAGLAGWLVAAIATLRLPVQVPIPPWWLLLPSVALAVWLVWHKRPAAPRILPTAPRAPDLTRPRVPDLHHARNAGAPIVLGRHRDTGQDVAVPIVGNSGWLVGGMSGSGKTTLLRLVFAHFALDPTAVIWGADGKGDHDDWGVSRHRCARWVDVNDDNSDRAYLDLLTDLHAEVNRRYATRRKDHPWLLCLLEEATNLRDMLDKGTREATDRMLRMVISKGRAANVLVVLAAQHPSTRLMPEETRGQVSIRICLHVANSRIAAFVLGDYPELDLVPNREERGHALLKVDGEPTRVVADYIDQRTWLDFASGLPSAGAAPGEGVPPSQLEAEVRDVLATLDRPLTAGELWQHLPDDVRTTSPETLGRALSAIGWNSRRVRVDGRQIRAYVLSQVGDDAETASL